MTGQLGETVKFTCKILHGLGSMYVSWTKFTETSSDPVALSYNNQVIPFSLSSFFLHFIMLFCIHNTSYVSKLSLSAYVKFFYLFAYTYHIGCNLYNIFAMYFFQSVRHVQEVNNGYESLNINIYIYTHTTPVRIYIDKKD